MAKDKRIIFCNALLIGASAYGLVSGAVNGKHFATAALILFAALGGVGIAVQFTNDRNLSKAEKHVYLIANCAGVDLLMTDVCIASSIDKQMAMLNLLPPAVDLIMYYLLDDTWEFVTPMTHIVTDALFFIFGFRDTKYILVVAGIAFLLALFGKGDRGHVSAANAAGVFSTGWFLGGKDLKDMGINF